MLQGCASGTFDPLWIVCTTPTRCDGLLELIQSQQANCSRLPQENWFWLQHVGSINQSKYALDCINLCVPKSISRFQRPTYRFGIHLYWGTGWRSREQHTNYGHWNLVPTDLGSVYSDESSKPSVLISARPLPDTMLAPIPDWIKLNSRCELCEKHFLKGRTAGYRTYAENSCHAKVWGLTIMWSISTRTQFSLSKHVHIVMTWIGIWRRHSHIL